MGFESLSSNLQTTSVGVVLVTLFGMFAGLALTHKYPNSSSLRPWTGIGTTAYVQVNNHTQISRMVYASAKVDSANRFLGLVPSCDSKTFKLPYADTKVLIDVNGAQYVLNVNKPKTFVLEIYNLQDGGCLVNSKIADRIIEFVDPSSWRQSGYWRQMDLTTPVQIIHAGDGTVCPVFHVEVTPILLGHNYTCKISWRFKSG